jgi:hypothetical protein
MRDPWRFLKTLPWLILLQNAALAVAIATVLDLLLVQLFLRLPASAVEGGAVALNLLFIVLPFVAAVGLGALSVVLLERLFRDVYLNTATLWALVPCLALALFIKGLLPAVPALLIGLSYPQVVGLVLGIFFRGKRYWRY